MNKNPELRKTRSRNTGRSTKMEHRTEEGTQDVRKDTDDLTLREHRD